jgi:hypothetical protein
VEHIIVTKSQQIFDMTKGIVRINTSLFWATISDEEKEVRRLTPEATFLFHSPDSNLAPKFWRKDYRSLSRIGGAIFR